MHLPNSVLYAASCLLVINAMFQFQFQIQEVIWGLESLGVSLGAFLLARKRGRQR